MNKLNYQAKQRLIDGEQVTASGGHGGVEGLSKRKKDSWTWTIVMITGRTDV